MEEQNIDQNQPQEETQNISQPAEQVSQPNQAFEPPKKDKPRRLPLKLKLILLGGFLIFGLFAASVIFRALQSMSVVDTNINVDQSEQPEDNVVPVQKELLTYKDEELKFAFDYLSSDELMERKEGEDIAGVYHKGSAQEKEVLSDSDLQDGYIFRVSVTRDVSAPNLSELANTKILSYRQSCPDIASVSGISDYTIDSIPAKTFNVTNCGVDYEEYFVYYENNVYQISKVLKGDFGYRQSYAFALEDLFDSFVFLDKKLVRDDTAPDVEIRAFFAKFTYPGYLTKCCSVPAPIGLSNVKIRTTLVDEQAYQASGQKSYDGIGISLYEFSKGETFESFLDNQKTALLDNYRVIKGIESPNPSEKKIVSVDGVEGVYLTGYAWWGDMVYFYSDVNRATLIFSIVEETPGSFDKGLDTIFGSLRLNLGY